MTYVPTSWVNGTTSVNAVNMNNIESGVVAAIIRTGDVMTGVLEIDRTLSGATKDFLILKATDGKDYRWRQDTSGDLICYNNTDGRAVLTLVATGDMITNKVYFGATDQGANATLSHDSTNHDTVITVPLLGAAHKFFRIISWNGSANVDILQIGGSTNVFTSAVWIDESGDIFCNIIQPANYYHTKTASAQSITGNGQTISLVSGKTLIRTTNAGSFTGIIVAAGTDGQEITIVNEGTGTITMAAQATSHVGDGTGCVIVVGGAIKLVYNSSVSYWHHVK